MVDDSGLLVIGGNIDDDDDNHRRKPNTGVHVPEYLKDSDDDDEDALAFHQDYSNLDKFDHLEPEVILSTSDKGIKKYSIKIPAGKPGEVLECLALMSNHLDTYTIRTGANFQGQSFFG